ncbi:MAG: hypothetical protein EXS43_06285 [Opitutus sp.]|nr:hypothetical protein [Opitutus sp.]
MKIPSPTALKAVLFVMFIMALVSAPFVLFGEDFVLPLLKSRENQAGGLIVIAVMLLAADSVAPVPSTLVVMFLAAKSGPVAGIIGGTVGLSIGVLAAGWIGRVAVGRVAPKFFPEAELARLRESLQQRLALTLACWRSVPVMAETTVIIAAAAGVPVRRIFWATLLPNFVVSVIYSVAADDSAKTAILTFFATLVLSVALWWIFGRRAGRSRKP